jgi:hypothetical protein
MQVPPSDGSCLRRYVHVLAVLAGAPSGPRRRIALVPPRIRLLAPTIVVLSGTTALVDSRTVLVDSRTALVDSRTVLVDSRTALVDSRTGLLAFVRFLAKPRIPLLVWTIGRTT